MSLASTARAGAPAAERPAAIVKRHRPRVERSMNNPRQRENPRSQSDPDPSGLATSTGQSNRVFSGPAQASDFAAESSDGVRSIEELRFTRENADAICAACRGTAASTAVRTSPARTPGTLAAATAMAGAELGSLLAAAAAAAGATTGTFQAMEETAAEAMSGFISATACPTAEATAAFSFAGALTTS